MSDFNAKMHQNRFRLGLRPRPRWRSLQRSPRPPREFAKNVSEILFRGVREGKGRGGKGERKGKGEGGREKVEKGVGRTLPYQSKNRSRAILTVCV